MTENQQNIIYNLSKEITNALASCEHYRNKISGNIDEIEANIEGYKERAKVLIRVRKELEIEFTTIHYDPR